MILVIGSAQSGSGGVRRPAARPGETLLGAFHSFEGGKGGNQAVAASGPAGKVAFLGRIGLDLFGARLLKSLQDNGVDTRLLGEVEGPSGVAIIMSGGGNNMIVVAPGANDRVTEDVITPDVWPVSASCWRNWEPRCPVSLRRRGWRARKGSSSSSIPPQRALCRGIADACGLADAQ